MSQGFNLLKNIDKNFEPERGSSKEGAPFLSDAQWGLYRNIRAYLRYKAIDTEGTPKPLSKTWGVECAQFVLYSYMIALVMKNFPNGLPGNIITIMSEIETEKTKAKKTEPNKIEVVLNELTNEFGKELHKISADPDVFGQLSINVKHTLIKDFYHNCILNGQLPVQMLGLLKSEALSEGNVLLTIDPIEQRLPNKL